MARRAAILIRGQMLPIKKENKKENIIRGPCVDMRTRPKELI